MIRIIVEDCKEHGTHCIVLQICLTIRKKHVAVRGQTQQVSCWYQ